MKRVVINPEYSRKYPDPLNKPETENPRNIEHYVLLCKASTLPVDIPMDPDPRRPKVDRLIYKNVKDSLLNEEDPTFHLKNKGMTIIAHGVNSDDKTAVEVLFDTGDGIVDGAHTYEIIRQNKEDCPDNQYVRMEILTGIPQDMVPSIAEGLNTAVQVQEMSLMNLKEEFKWIQDTLAGEQYADQIAYEENQDKPFDVRDIVAFLTIFNIDEFPDSSRHPKVAYTSKAECLALYKKSQESYKKLKPLIKDILILHDYIQAKSNELYNKKYAGKGGNLKFYQHYKKPKTKPRRKFQLLFTGKETEFKLYDGALYPVLGAFRYLVEQKNGSQCFSWKMGSLNEVKRIFDEIGGDLINATRNTSDSHAKNPNAIGKDESHWDNLYNKVAITYLQKTNVS